MTMTAFIFARGGSKGLPGKNIRHLAGKPLIAWSIEQALACSNIGRVIVSTDSPQIAEVARAHGAETPFLRPAELAADTTPEWLAWRHALEFMRDAEGALPYPFISVPATSPLRLPEDIAACIKEFERSGADAAFAVTEAHRSPWFNMVACDPSGSYHPVNNPAGSITRRQDSPLVFDMTTAVYILRSRFVLENQGLFTGRTAAIVIAKERSIDIDTSHDFDIAEYLMTKRINSVPC